MGSTESTWNLSACSVYSWTCNEKAYWVVFGERPPGQMHENCRSSDEQVLVSGSPWNSSWHRLSQLASCCVHQVSFVSLPNIIITLSAFYFTTGYKQRSRMVVHTNGRGIRGRVSLSSDQSEGRGQCNNSEGLHLFFLISFFFFPCLFFLLFEEIKWVTRVNCQLKDIQGWEKQQEYVDTLKEGRASVEGKTAVDRTHQWTSDGIGICEEKGLKEGEWEGGTWATSRGHRQGRNVLVPLPAVRKLSGTSSTQSGTTVLMPRPPCQGS